MKVHSRRQNFLGKVLGQFIAVFPVDGVVSRPVSCAIYHIFVVVLARTGAISAQCLG
jgi:hypothetical protein